MGGIRWRVFCEKCGWSHEWPSSREQAISFGKWHVKRCPDDGDEYQFRVQGKRFETEESVALRSVTLGNKVYAAHRWQAHPTSRSKSLPCGVCGMYQYVHDENYGYVVLEP